MDTALPALTTSAKKSLLEDRFSRQIDLLINWACINSGSSNMDGLAQMCTEISSLFSPLADSTEKLQADRVTEIDDQGAEIEIPVGDILIFRKRPESKRRVLLVGHMDTVFDVDSGFQSCQWLEDNILNGPGVADMKGGLLVIYQALTLFEESPVASNIGWDLLISGDEETSSRGSARYLAEEAKNAEIGLVYEPALADGTLSGERKGTGNFTFVIRGRSAHAGREFHLGRNALAMAANAMAKLHKLNEKRNSITLNLGRVSGGDALNKVPDLAVIRFNARVQSDEDQQWLLQQFENILAEINATQGYSAEQSGKFTRPPKTFDENQIRLNDLLVQTGSDLGIEISFKATGGCCDGNNLKAAGLANIDTMGVRGGNIHSEDEFVLIDSLPERALLSLQLLERWATTEDFKTTLRNDA